MNKINPLYKLFDYACDRFYYIEYGERPYTKTMKGILLNYSGSMAVILAEEGMYQIKQRDVQFMAPTSIPAKASEEYRNLIKEYLSECAAQS